MDFDMSNRIHAVVASAIHSNNYKALMELIRVLHYYTTMGFSHCSSSGVRSQRIGQIPTPRCLPAQSSGAF